MPLQFLGALLAYLGDTISYYDSPSPGLTSTLASQSSACYPGINAPCEGFVRWQLRLSPAIEDLKQCLDYTEQHSKLVESFISALRYRLLTAGAPTNDILHQYVSTIKSLSS